MPTLNQQHSGLLRILFWLGLASILGLISLTIGCGGSVTPAITPPTKPIPPPTATVYVQNQTGGVSSFSASQSGGLTATLTFQLTSPNESLIGANSNLIVSYSGDDYLDRGLSVLHTYTLDGHLLSSIDTQLFPGCNQICYFTGDVSLNSNLIYIAYAGPNDDSDFPGWAGVQTFTISKAGTLSFLSDSADPAEVGNLSTPDGLYAYGAWADQGQNTGVSVFSSSAAGLQYLSTNYLENQINPVGDSFGNIAVVVDSPYNDTALLASYSTDNLGNLTTTNNFENLPVTANLTPNPNNYVGTFLGMNPAGDTVALAVSAGIQLFHFNGSAEPTNFTTIPLSASSFVTAIAWDKFSNLYALDGSNGDIHIYTANSTEASGSPYKIDASEIVVSQ